jgi:hypothetical protein
MSRRFRFPTQFALTLLLVAGGGMATFALLRQGEPASATPPVVAPALPSPTTGPGVPAVEVPPVAVPAPVAIRIAAIGASAPVDPLGLNADGTLEVPTDYSRAGYYTGRSMPGATGPAIIVAHVDSKAGPAVFYRLRDLKPGAEVAVTRADGTEVVFVVDRLEQHAKNAFPTDAVYGPTPDATLRLVTCGGSWDASAGHYRDNTIVFAHLRA